MEKGKRRMRRGKGKRMTLKLEDQTYNTNPETKNSDASKRKIKRHLFILAPCALCLKPLLCKATVI
jgi:hypothetical protein